MTDRKEERVKFFDEFITNFTKTNLQTIFSALCEDYNIKDSSIEIVDDSHESINWAYWDLIDNHARPIIETLESDEAEDRVDIYKMLSCIEYAILKISPYYILKNSGQIDYSDDNNIELKHIEDITNGYLAFYGALEFLKRWAGKYAEVFQSDEIMKQLDSVEEIEHRVNAMTLLSEHIYVAVYSSKSSVIPLFTNACWWRLVCTIGVKIHKG